MSTPTPTSGALVALSVHGPAGVVDLQVPPGASGADVAAEYSRQASLPTAPRLYTSLGRPLPAGVTLADAGVGNGAVLLATEQAGPSSSAPSSSPGPSARTPSGVAEPVGKPVGKPVGPEPRPWLATLWCLVAAAVALLAGAYAAGSPDSVERDVALGSLIVAAVLGCLPGGSWASQRALAAPAFAGAAALALAWDPAATRLPGIVGIALLASASCAALAWALGRRGEEGLRVWIVVGAGVGAVATGSDVVGVDAQTVWALLLVAATVAARFVPLLAVGVPDHHLLDLERLAVTAWSAHDRPSPERGRAVVPRRLVVEASRRASRLMTASCVAILLVATTSSALLLREVSLTVDTIGARVEVGFCGAALLLASRSHRHRGPRTALRAAGLACWVALSVALLDSAGQGLVVAVTAGAATLGAVAVLVGVAVGRGWRSVGWARRADLAEAFSTGLGVASVVVAAGFTSALWK